MFPTPHQLGEPSPFLKYSLLKLLPNGVYGTLLLFLSDEPGHPGLPTHCATGKTLVGRKW